jgi:MFS family permease
MLSLLRVPAFVAMLFAGTCITFSSVSIITWGIDFAVGYKEFSVREASVSLAVVALLALILGVLSGGFFADRLHRKYAYGRVLVIAGAFLCAAPFVLLAIQTDEKWVFLAALAVGAYFMSWYHGPVTAVLHDLTPQRAHSTSIGIYMFVTQLLGALGPQLVGKISDASDLQLGLQVAVAVMVFGSLLMSLVIYFVRRDGLHHPRLASFRVEPAE